MSTLETVRFRAPALDREGIEVSTAWLARQPGFRARLVARAGDGEVLDLVTWDDAEASRAAIATFLQAPENAALLSAVEADSTEMRHLEVLFEWPVIDLHRVAEESLKQCEAFFARSTSLLAEEHSGFRPSPEMMTVAEQVAHVAISVEWFVEGALGRGFDLDFEAGAREAASFTSLAAARARLERAFANARACWAAASAAELAAPLPENPIMSNKPRFTVLAAIEEHTAHHRGALAVYARLLGLEPLMPYG